MPNIAAVAPDGTRILVEWDGTGPARILASSGQIVVLNVFQADDNQDISGTPLGQWFIKEAISEFVPGQPPVSQNVLFSWRRLAQVPPGDVWTWPHGETDITLALHHAESFWDEIGDAAKTVGTIAIAVGKDVVNWTPLGPAITLAESVAEGKSIWQALGAAAEREAQLVEDALPLIPGIGSGIAAALAAAVAILEGDSALEIALRAAYQAIPIPPPLHDVTDAIFDGVLDLAKGENITDVAIQTFLNEVPDGLARDVANTLLQIVVAKKPVVQSLINLGDQVAHEYGGPAADAAFSAAENIATSPTHQGPDYLMDQAVACMQVDPSTRAALNVVRDHVELLVAQDHLTDADLALLKYELASSVPWSDQADAVLEIASKYLPVRPIVGQLSGSPAFRYAAAMLLDKRGGHEAINAGALASNLNDEGIAEIRSALAPALTGTGGYNAGVSPHLLDGLHAELIPIAGDILKALKAYLPNVRMATPSTAAQTARNATAGQETAVATSSPGPHVVSAAGVAAAAKTKPGPHVISAGAVASAASSSSLRPEQHLDEVLRSHGL